AMAERAEEDFAFAVGVGPGHRVLSVRPGCCGEDVDRRVPGRHVDLVVDGEVFDSPRDRMIGILDVAAKLESRWVPVGVTTHKRDRLAANPPGRAVDANESLPALDKVEKTTLLIRAQVG